MLLRMVHCSVNFLIWKTLVIHSLFAGLGKIILLHISFFFHYLFFFFFSLAFNFQTCKKKIYSFKKFEFKLWKWLCLRFETGVWKNAITRLTKKEKFNLRKKLQVENRIRYFLARRVHEDLPWINFRITCLFFNLWCLIGIIPCEHLSRSKQEKNALYHSHDGVVLQNKFLPAKGCINIRQKSWKLVWKGKKKIGCVCQWKVFIMYP